MPPCSLSNSETASPAPIYSLLGTEPSADADSAASSARAAAAAARARSLIDRRRRAISVREVVEEQRVDRIEVVTCVRRDDRIDTAALEIDRLRTENDLVGPASRQDDVVALGIEIDQTGRGRCAELRRRRQRVDVAARWHDEEVESSGGHVDHAQPRMCRDAAKRIRDAHSIEAPGGAEDHERRT